MSSRAEMRRRAASAGCAGLGGRVAFRLIGGERAGGGCGFLEWLATEEKIAMRPRLEICSLLILGRLTEILITDSRLDSGGVSLDAGGWKQRHPNGPGEQIWIAKRAFCND
jgi:hypothetical protein